MLKIIYPKNKKVNEAGWLQKGKKKVFYQDTNNFSERLSLLQ